MRSLLIPGFAIAAAVGLVSMAHGHEGDIFVGLNSPKSAPGAQYLVENGFDGAIELAPNGFAPFTGYFLDAPGFASNDENEPDEGFFALPANANVVFELVSIDPGLRVYDDLLGEILPGGTWRISPLIGDPGVFDDHPYWHIDDTHPSFVPGATYELTYRLIDPTGYYAPSEIETLSFIPEPGSLLLLTAGAALLRRRR